MTTVQEQLAQSGSLHEVYEVRTFRGFKNSSNVEVEIRIWDRGESEDGRFMVEAYDLDLPAEDRHGGSPNWTMGDAADDLTAAISLAHWNQVGEKLQ